MRIGEALFAGSLATLAGPLAPELPADTDPVFVAAFEACLDGIVGGLPPEQEGWTSHDTGNVDAQAWDNWTSSFATKDIEGVGGLSLSTTIENYPGYDVGHCRVSMASPEREIAAPALLRAGFKGTLEGDAADWSGVWRNSAGSLFVRSTMSTNADRFELFMTGVSTEGPK